VSVANWCQTKVFGEEQKIETCVGLSQW